jgi:hypothetical protein
LLASDQLLALGQSGGSGKILKQLPVVALCTHPGAHTNLQAAQNGDGSSHASPGSTTPSPHAGAEPPLEAALATDVLELDATPPEPPTPRPPPPAPLAPELDAPVLAAPPPDPPPAPAPVAPVRVTKLS